MTLRQFHNGCCTLCFKEHFTQKNHFALFALNWLVTVCYLTHFTQQHTLHPEMFFSLEHFGPWYNSKIRPSTWRDVNKEYLPYPTYIHIGDPYKKRGSDNQSQLPTNICHGHTVQITSYREYINIFVCKRLLLFLTSRSYHQEKYPVHSISVPSPLCLLETLCSSELFTP